jgi:hypothetical protein
MEDGPSVVVVSHFWCLQRGTITVPGEDWRRTANCYNVSKCNELTIEARTMKFIYDRLLIHHSSVPIGVM